MVPSRTPSSSRKATANQLSTFHQQRSSSPQGRGSNRVGGNSQRRRPTPKSSIDTIASSALKPVPPNYQSQISIPSNAMWRCKSCFNLYPIEHARFDRPLGYFRCTTCHSCPQFDLVNIPRIERVLGIEYAISIPRSSGEPTEGPHSLFVWVCCTCGRSWPQVPVPQRLSLPTSQHSHERGRIFRRIFRRHAPTPKDETQVDLGSSGYTTHIITFNSGCLCAHYTCENCYRAIVLAEGENISRRLQRGEVVKVSPEQLERKRNELIDRGDDPEQYFPWH